MSTQINPKALKKAVNTNSVVLFFADWCPHCQVMKPVYERVSRGLKAGDLKNVHFTKMDYAKHGEEVTHENIGKERFGAGVHTAIKGFPTILFFSKQGDSEMYAGGPDPENLSSAIRAFFSN